MIDRFCLMFFGWLDKRIAIIEDFYDWDFGKKPKNKKKK